MTKEYEILTLVCNKKGLDSFQNMEWKMDLLKEASIRLFFGLYDVKYDC